MRILLMALVTALLAGPAAAHRDRYLCARIDTLREGSHR